MLGLRCTALPAFYWRALFSYVRSNDDASAALASIASGGKHSSAAPESSSEPAVRHRGTAQSDSHLTGLRGLATLLVYNWHILLPFYPKIFEPYKDRQSSSIVQLPFIKIAVLGYPMVHVFACLSGYVQSLQPLRSARAKGPIPTSFELVTRPCRRAVRIWLSCLPVTFTEMVAARFDLFRFSHLPADVPHFLQHMFPITAPSLTAQLKDWIAFSISLANIIQGPILPDSNYGPHLWTIVFDLRSSLILSLVLSYTLHLDATTRLLRTSAILLLYGTVGGDAVQQITISTLIGYLLAQLHTDPGNALASLILRHLEAWSTPLCLLGLYLTTCALIIPPAEYVPFVSTSVLLYYTGVRLLATTLILSPPTPVRRLLETSFLQRLGRTSFSFYLVHQAPTLLLGYPMVKYLRDTQGLGNGVAIAITTVTLLPLCLVLGELFNKYVEGPVSRWLGKWWRSHAT